MDKVDSLKETLARNKRPTWIENYFKIQELKRVDKGIDYSGFSNNRK